MPDNNQQKTGQTKGKAGNKRTGQPHYTRKPGKQRRKLVRQLADIGFPALHRLLTSRCKVTYSYHREAQQLLESNNGLILAWWHEYELVLLPHGSEPSRSTLLLSPSKDGRILAKSAAKMGYRIISGSSRRGGGLAMAEMTKALKQGQRVIITPDGPLGPRHRAKPGAVRLAANTGCGIIPVTVNASHCYRKNSWDRLVIPLIQSKLEVHYGRPIYATLEQADAANGQLTAALSGK